LAPCLSLCHPEVFGLGMDVCEAEPCISSYESSGELQIPTSRSMHSIASIDCTRDGFAVSPYIF
jgi:hypothetical protein